MLFAFIKVLVVIVYQEGRKTKERLVIPDVTTEANAGNEVHFLATTFEAGVAENALCNENLAVQRTPRAEVSGKASTRLLRRDVAYSLTSA